MIARGNLLTYGASHGIQVRPGGVLDQNVFYKNAIGAFTAHNENVGEAPSLIWRCVFLEGRSPYLVWGGSAYAETGGNRGFEFNRGRDTFMTECIVAMPEQSGYGSSNARGVAFENVLTTDRCFMRNNTIRVAETNGLFRSSTTSNAFAEFVADYNIISQPDSGSGTFLAHWQANVFGSALKFANNSYFSTGDECSPAAEWFRVAGTGLCPSTIGTGWLALTNDTTSVLETADPPFDDPTVDLGSYNDDILGGDDDPEDLIAAFLTRKRSEWNEDETAAAVIDYIRDGYTPVCFDLAPDGRHYGAVPYTECLGLAGGGGEGGCEGDFDRDGAATPADLAAFQRAFIAGHRRADLNRDGLVNVADLAAFNAALSAGCP